MSLSIIQRPASEMDYEPIEEKFAETMRAHADAVELQTILCSILFGRQLVGIARYVRNIIRKFSYARTAFQH